MKFNTSLALKFTILAIFAVVLPTMIIAGSLIVLVRKSLTESIYREQLEIARRITDRLSVHAENIRSVLAIAASEPGIASFSRVRQEESLRRLLRWQPNFQDAMILNSSGMEAAKVEYHDKRFSSETNFVSHKNKPEFLDALKTNRAVIGQPFFGTDRLPYLLASCPTYRERAVLVVRVPLANLWDLVKQVREGQPGVVYIVDAKGNLIAHRDPLRVQMHANLSQLPIVKFLKEDKSGHNSFGLYDDERGNKVVGLVQKVPALGWGVVVEVPVARAYAPIRTMQKEVMKWTAICVIGVLGFVFWRMRYIIQPIEMLEEGVRKISQGQLDLNLNIKTGDELEQLARSFEKMAKTLKHVEQVKEDLTSMLVHDLKSPLSSIVGGVDYILDSRPAKLTEAHLRILSVVRKSCDDLLSMIQNLLDVAKMEDGQLELKPEKVLASKLLEECLDNFHVQAEREGKSLFKKNPTPDFSLLVDHHLIRRVLNNLLTNALRHTADGKGRITLSAESCEGQAALMVADNGEGIPSQYRGKIFNKFFQAERRRTKFRRGSGLGLTFCKMVVELHKGQISVESEIGKGSIFKVTLPILEKVQTAKTEVLAQV